MDCEGTDETAYRFDILEHCNLEWLDKLRALGINPNATGSDKSFLTGPGRYFDYGGIEVVAGNHMNIPYPKNEVVSMVAYHDFAEIGEPHVFPFHSVCYEVLKRCISLRQPGEIQGNNLYQVFEQANGGRYVRLQLDYGEPDPPVEQVWETLRGQEILVVNPVDIPELESEINDIKCLLDTKTYLNNETKLHKDDLFSRLSNELRHEIFKHLPPESILALKAASRIMHTTWVPRSMWEAKLVDTYPWLWEVLELPVFQSQDIEEKTSRLLFACREQGESTGRSYGYILGLANRRRIWGANTVAAAVTSAWGDIEVILQTLITSYSGLNMTNPVF
ncbi:F-box protein [Aspergillus vadensis CBS 113365]|uniref:F-box domain protein n=1 Tax=Aspergillus vadensis (strain CBS 113365 / IMI 142717 / IBT 24658) TaxID=1448311 RepID=A0A319B5Q7_ASPVC|nr:F-box domain protein [Aspergillus vadensis CBS 113365]PYH67659.1 F-box domain protein [Aspergillus vadensis CBS 113365]